MRELTVADAAFLLLCTSRHGSFQLSLSTEIGLHLDISSDGAITVCLEKPNCRPKRRQSATPYTPVSPTRNSIDAMMLTPTSAVAPDFPLFFPTTGLCFTRSNTPPLTPKADRSPSSSLRGQKPLSVKTIHPPPIPTAGPTPPASPAAHVKSQQAYKYLITPYYASPSSSLLSDGTRTSSYILYTPNWPTNPRSSTLSSVSPISKPQTPNSPRNSDVATEAPAGIIVGEEDLEARYSSSSLVSSNGASLRPGSGSKWLETYHDWVSRSRRAYARQRRRESRRASHTPHCDSHGHHTTMKKKDSKGPFKDEGESTLWMVEGLMLSVWLCLQGDCAGVEYAPWGVTSAHLRGTKERSVNREAEYEHIYTLEKNTVGCVIRHILDGLSWC
ncbi:hypothetical protein V8F33_006910 [Rhypophila sp. PSN 637]